MIKAFCTKFADHHNCSEKFKLQVGASLLSCNNENKTYNKISDNSAANQHLGSIQTAPIKRQVLQST
jgi:hypothetical protein